MCWRSMLAPLLLLSVVIAVASSTAVASTAASMGLLIHSIQRGHYRILDLLLYDGAHAMDLYLHVIDVGLTIFQC